MIWYGKTYISNCGKPAHFAYIFNIILRTSPKTYNKLLGYWNMYYDGYFHFFALYPIQFHWCKVPKLLDED